MVDTIEMSVETQKIRLVQQILNTTNRNLLYKIEEIISIEILDFSDEDDSEEEVFSEEELAFVGERIAEAKANPDESIPFSEFLIKMRANLL